MGATTTHAREGTVPGPPGAALCVPEGGFLWDVGTGSLGPRLQMKLEPAPGFRYGPALRSAGDVLPPAYRWYDPFSEPALHRKLAQLPPSPDRILRFANRYGYLTHGYGGSGLERMHPANRQRACANRFVSESLGDWVREILDLSLLVDISDMLKRGEIGKLGQWIRWTDRPRSVSVVRFRTDRPLDRLSNRRVRLPAHRVRELGATGLALSTAEVMSGEPFVFDEPGLEARRGPPSLRQLFPYYSVHLHPIAIEGRGDPLESSLSRWPFGVPTEPATYYLRQQIDRALDGHVSPSVPGLGGGTLTFEPDCLLSAIYMHFALEVVGQTRQTIMCQNVNCGKYFSPEHGSLKVSAHVGRPAA